MRGPRLSLRPRALARAGLVVAAACAVVASGTPALAGGVVGDPQPELAPFRLAPTGGTGSGAVLPDGDLVVASPSKSATTISVCVLVPGGRSCASTTTLHAFHNSSGQDTFYGSVEVLATGGDDVSVVALDCCYIGSNGAVVFDSTDGGRTFHAMIEAGNIASIGTATFADGNIVVGSVEQGGLQVQAFSPNPSTPEQSYAVPAAGEDGDTALGTYHGGVLVANDDLTNTHVEFAKAGSGLNSTSSYVHVATFPKELTVAVSGDALLTDPGGSITGGERLRIFNGTSFGPGERVPDTKAGDDGYFAMQQTGGVVHVFLIGRRDGYDVFEESTSNGVRWTPLTQYASAIVSDDLEPVLGPTGAGLLVEGAGTPENAQPVLNPQHVTVRFATPRVHVGHPAVLHGTVAPRLVNQLVTLETLRGGAWFPVKSTRETAAGTFTFSVAGATATYRAVVALRPGLYEYGYSNAASLTAVT